MEICFQNRETGEEITYHDAVGYFKAADNDGPVIQAIFEDGETATFHRSEWDCFVREWKEVE